MPLIADFADSSVVKTASFTISVFGGSISTNFLQEIVEPIKKTIINAHLMVMVIFLNIFFIIDNFFFIR
jgi:hypothetical protein